MTARQLWEATLIELNKVQAPSLLLEDYNYFINKAIYQYINKRYNIYDINQQTADDLRVLKGTAKLSVSSDTNANADSLYGSGYQFDLPQDYLHMLNCICEFQVEKPFKCYDADTTVHFKATRLTADLYGEVLNNYYMRPSYKKPYYYINNINTSSEKANTNVGQVDGGNLPTNPIDTNGRGTDVTKVEHVNIEALINGDYGTTAETDGLLRTIHIGDYDFNKVEKIAKVRYGNPSNVRMEIRYGKDTSLFKLQATYIDYIKTPQHIRLTQSEIDLVEDHSQILEFPDYVCHEIVNELVHIVMENTSDPRLQTHIPVSQSIANPAQQQTQQK